MERNAGVQDDSIDYSSIGVYDDSALEYSVDTFDAEGAERVRQQLAFEQALGQRAVAEVVRFGAESGHELQDVEPQYESSREMGALALREVIHMDATAGETATKAGDDAETDATGDADHEEYSPHDEFGAQATSLIMKYVYYRDESALSALPTRFREALTARVQFDREHYGEDLRSLPPSEFDGMVSVASIGLAEAAYGPEFWEDAA